MLCVRVSSLSLSHPLFHSGWGWNVCVCVRVRVCACMSRVYACLFCEREGSCQCALETWRQISDRES